MNPWPFVIGAYAIAVSAAALLIIWAWISMRRAEDAADRLGRQ